MHVHSEHVNTVTSFPQRVSRMITLTKLQQLVFLSGPYPHSIGYIRFRRAKTNRSDIQYLICVGHENWNQKDGNNDRNVD